MDVRKTLTVCRTARQVALSLIALIPTVICLSCATVRSTQVVSRPGGTAVSPALQENLRHVLKRRVVIVRFTNETLYGKSVLLTDKADLIARQASDILATRLAESGKFLLFERSDSERVLKALDRGELHTLGFPGDHLIIGSVSEFGRETTGKTGVFSRTKLQKAQAKVNVRLIDVKSSRVIFADEGAGEATLEVGTVLGIGTKAGYDSTLNDKAISAAISKVVGNLLENLLEQPWRAYVLTVEEEHVIIGGGASQGLRRGDRLQLVRRGKRVQNPQTNSVVELPGEKVGVLEVASVFGDTPEEEGARCLVVSGTLPRGDLREYIVEEVSS